MSKRQDFLMCKISSNRLQLRGLNVSFLSVFKRRSYLIVSHRRDAYKGKKKTMSDVKCICLFFKVANVPTWWCTVSQLVNLLPVSRSPSRGCGPMS